jgi:hypothetical protein
MSVSIVHTLRVLKPAATLVLVAFIGILVGYYANTTFFPGTSPEQPIDFSHRIHAGENEIPCQYCHVQARRSISAGVPSVNKCMGCHNEVATDRPQIKLLTNYWETKEVIPWVKVHDLPDFVHFTHKRHVAADVACQTCHGPVETMDVVSREAPVKMGLCLNCHKDNEVQFGTDCWTCHK